MHRHGYKGRKLGRTRDQRRALIKGLAGALIDQGTILTTEPKAKEIRPYVEKLITKAKRGDLHSRRQIIAKVAHASSAHKLVDEIAPNLAGRDSGFLRIEREDLRRGDGSQMSRVSFVDDLKSAPVAKAQPAKVADKPKQAAKAKSPKPAPKKAKDGAK